MHVTGVSPAAHVVEERQQLGIRVAEERRANLVVGDRWNVVTRPEVALRAPVVDESVARVEKPALAQQPAGPRRESGKPETARERQARVRRREAMRAVDPRFGRQVFEHEPDRRDRSLRSLHHRGDVTFGQTAAERLDRRVGNLGVGERLVPAANRDAHRMLERELAIDCRARCARAARDRPARASRRARARRRAASRAASRRRRRRSCRRLGRRCPSGRRRA